MKGRYGEFGGQYVPELLIKAMGELELAFDRAIKDKEFSDELNLLLSTYAGRPTPLYFAKNLSKRLGFKVYLKREDLLHTGAHKINNAIGQALLAKKMGKTRIIAETGAGQHGVAAATACTLLGLKCEVYMGKKDMERQMLNVFRMNLLGAKVIEVTSGSQTLKDAVNEAMRDYAANFENTHYLLGSALGPHPYPLMVRHFQSVIGKEAKKQIMDATGKMPNYLVACVGGGSNAIGLFYPFLNENNVKMIGVEAGGMGIKSGKHAARISGDGKKGILHGYLSYLLEDENGQIRQTHSVSAGLDYPSIGPEHAYLHEQKRAQYANVDDKEALEGFELLCKLEGIIPALESAHAIAYLLKMKCKPDDVVIVNLSGRGDKDVEQISKMGINEGGKEKMELNVANGEDKNISNITGEAL